MVVHCEHSSHVWTQTFLRSQTNSLLFKPQTQPSCQSHLFAAGADGRSEELFWNSAINTAQSHSGFTSVRGNNSTTSQCWKCHCEMKKPKNTHKHPICCIKEGFQWLSTVLFVLRTTKNRLISAPRASLQLVFHWAFYLISDQFKLETSLLCHFSIHITCCLSGFITDQNLSTKL